MYEIRNKHIVRRKIFDLYVTYGSYSLQSDYHPYSILYDWWKKFRLFFFFLYGIYFRAFFPEIKYSSWILFLQSQHLWALQVGKPFFIHFGRAVGRKKALNS